MIRDGAEVTSTGRSFHMRAPATRNWSDDPSTSNLVVSAAQLMVARRTHDRKVVGSIPANAVQCFTVVR